MLRSIVYQIWTQNKRLWPFLRDKYRTLKARSDTTAPGEQLWEYEDLKTVLRSLQNVDFALQVFIIVDGMDESESGRQNDVLRFLLELSQPTGPERPCAIKVLVASRPEVNITIHLHNCRHIVLQDVNRGDIQKAIDEGIRQLACDASTPPTRFSSIKDYIKDNSQGVFLWVSLVLQDLKRHVQRGTYSMAGLEKRVRGLPKELGGPDGFYRSIVDSLIKRQAEDEPYEDQRDDPVAVARKLLLWATFSSRPMRLEEFEDILATPARLGSTEESDYDFEAHRPQNIERGLFFYCGGLVEVSTVVAPHRTCTDEMEQIRKGMVQLIHQTVREFLLDLKQPARPLNLEEAEGDREIAATCCRYLLLRFTTSVFRQDADSSLEQLQQISQALSATDLLLVYCFSNLKEHLDNFHNKGEERLPEFVALAEMLKSRPSSTASFLLSQWFKKTTLDTCASSDADAQYHLQSALVFAAGTGSRTTVTLLEILGADPDGPSEDGMDALVEAAKRGHADKNGNDFHFGDDNADVRFYKDFTPVQVASTQGHLGIITVLLNRGARVDAASLHAASLQGHHKIVQLLLNRGADLNARNQEGSTVLQVASARGHQKLVIFLLKMGADANAKNHEGSTALQVALTEGHEEIAEILREYGEISRTSR